LYNKKACEEEADKIKKGVGYKSPNPRQKE
jgi:hypothetical protein